MLLLEMKLIPLICNIIIKKCIFLQKNLRKKLILYKYFSRHELVVYAITNNQAFPSLRKVVPLSSIGTDKT